MTDAAAVSPLIVSSRKLAERLRPLAFTKASHVYLPLDYARESHEEYLRRYGMGPKRVVFLGMNPGSYVPFLQYRHIYLKSNNSQIHN